MYLKRINMLVFSLRQMDLELMKRLHRKVNIVVVIAKADTLTAPEVAKLKQNILNDIKDNDIQVINNLLFLEL